MAAFDPIDPELLARDSVRLLRVEYESAAPEHTRRAARLVRQAIERQLDDADLGEVLASFDEDGRTDELAATVVLLARDDPDFARRLLVAINSDVIVDHRTVGASVPAAGAPSAMSFPPGLRLVSGIALVVVGLVLGANNQTVSALCDLELSEPECRSATILYWLGMLLLVAGGAVAGQAIWRLTQSNRP